MIKDIHGFRAYTTMNNETYYYLSPIASDVHGVYAKWKTAIESGGDEQAWNSFEMYLKAHKIVEVNSLQWYDMYERFAKDGHYYISDDNGQRYRVNLIHTYYGRF